MNSHQITEAALNRYESDKRAWEDAIRAYSGADSLDIWFNYICWLEQHKVFDKDGGFRKILEQCLSNFENFENYKQDVRMVKLWMKFIDMQANPLNLYQFLYKKNVGTQCACFYIGWAHYYDAANAFKQAESIYNLGIQVKAQPMDELQEAQNKFRLSIAQRMLYNDASSKKRSANTLVEQRQQITSLSPPQKKMKTEGGDYYSPQPQAVVQQHPQHQQNQVQNHVQPTVQQHQHHPQTQQPVHQPQQNYVQQGYYQQQQYQQQQQTSAPATMTAAEQYYQQDKQNSTYYQNNQHHYVQQHQQHPQHQVHQSQTPTPASVQSTVLQQPHAPAQHHAPVQRQMPPQQQQLHPQVHSQNVAPVATQSRPPAVQPVQNPPHATMVQQPQIQPQPQSRVPPPQPVPVQPTPPPPQAQPAPQPQPTPQPVQSQPPEQPPVHRSVIIENYALGNESLTECNLNNSAYVISSSLNYVYDDANLTGYTLEEPQPEEKVDTGPTGIRLPDNFVREARSNHERWDVPLCLEEPYEANRKCCYPKGFVYPDLHTGKPTMDQQVHQAAASPHHYAQQPTPQAHHHQHHQHPQQFHHQQQHVHPPVQQQPPAAAFQPPAQTRPPAPVQYQKPTPQPTPPPPRPTTPHLQPPVKPVPPVQPIQRPPPPQKLLPPKQPPLRPPAPPAAVKPSPVNVRNNQFNDCDDIEEQIEASTIRFSTSAENGTCKSKTITIKFKKEKSSAPSPVNVPPGGPNHPQPKPMATSSANHLDANHHKPKNLPSVGISGSNSNSMAQPSRKNAAPGATPPERSKSNNVKKSKPSSSKAKSSSKYEPNATVVPAANRVNDANLLLSLAAGENDDSSQSYGGSSPEVVRQKKKDKNKSKVVRRYIDDDDDEEDVYEREEGEYLGDSEEDDFEDEEEDEEDSDENDSSYQSNSEFNTSFSNISFAGDNSNGAFNFGGSSCSTPMRKISGSGASKTSTPIGSFRYLKKHESNLSLLGQNEEDSMNSTVVENSYFQTEQDEEAKRRRKEKALGIIDTHLAKPFLDPFSSELCKAFLTKIDFPTRENEDNYKVVNNNLPKLVKSQTAALGGIVYSIEKEVGRGSYGSVFRAVNTQSGAVVAIKYQKPANSWELYICTEVRKRIKNPDILPGFMDICSAVIAPNASVLVSEFSQYGSLLDINNTIRTATTKVMHESLVMHFSSQILSIVDYLHKCNIVHADIKPDANEELTFCEFVGGEIRSQVLSVIVKCSNHHTRPTVESDIPTLRLIDFGCAIDMNFFEKKRQFKKVIQTDGFTCIEMQEGRPWSFQTDLFCVAGTIHVMLFGEYMQLTKKYDSDWDIKQKLPRYLKKHVWTEVFQKLLNIKDIDHMPKLGTLKELIDAEAFNMESELVKHIRTLSNLLKRR
ncbi:hypothetical protein RP20_CCG010316 [Aedes albopictus]|nr:hypothetical protein RP20_CCG010316 [Aedes albopictus]